MEKTPNQTAASVFRNVLFGFSTWILPLALSFLATPIVVRTLGNSDYGIYALVLGFVGYSFNFNLGRAVTKYIAEYRASGETDKLQDIVSSAFFLNMFAGTFGIACILLTANWLVTNVFRIEEAAQNKSVTALYIASLIIFSTSLNQIFIAILQGIHRFDVYSKILNGGNIALLIGNLALVIYGQGLLSLLFWNLTINLLSCIFFWVWAKRLMPEFKIDFKFKRETLKTVLRYSAAIIGYQILSNFLLLFERGWITRHLGSESLTFYVVPMTLAICIHGFVSSLVMVIFPLASELKNEKEKLLRLYTKATKIVCFFVVFFAAALITQSDVFLTLWMGQDFAEKSSALLIIQTITFSILAIQTVSWQMTEGLGYPNYNFSVFAVCLIINVFVILGLTESLGNTGIALGRFAGFGTIFLSVFFVERWIFGRIQIEFWLKLTGVLAIAATISGFVIRFIIEHFPVAWISLFTATFFGGIIYLLVIWLLGFVTVDEKKLIRKFLLSKNVDAQKI